MADVKVKFAADFVDVQHAAHEISKLAKKTAKDVKEPFDGILESEKKVERSMGNIARSIGSIASPADAVASIMDNMENSFKGSMMVGGAVAIGMALNQALNEAAKGMDAFSAKIEKSMGEAFDVSTEGLDKMKSMIDDLAADKADDGLFERLIFGGQKEELIASQEKALELAQRLVALKKEAESAEALTQSSRQTRADRLKYQDFDTNTFAGAEDKARANEEVSWMELQLKQYAELKKAQEEYNKILQDKTATEITKANYKEILEQVKERAKLESDALENEIRGARERRELDRTLAEQERDNAIEQLTFMTEREKLHLSLEQAQERLNTLSHSQAATEKEIKDAKFAQIKAAADLETWARKEINAYADITKSQFERQQIGKSALDQQHMRVKLLELEAEELADNADKAEEYEKKLTELANERLKLKEAEREEEQKLLDIQHERIQMAERDPYIRAQNEATWAQERANEISARPDASESQKQQAALEAEKARQAVIDTAVGMSPSLEAIAGTDPESMEALSRAANRGGPNRYQQAQQSLARAQLAQAQLASNPYDVATRERSTQTRKEAMIQAGKAKGIVGRDALENEKLRKMTESELKTEMDRREAEALRDVTKEEQDRAQEKWEEENPFDAKLKREGKEYDKEKDPEEIAKQEKKRTEEEKPKSTMEENIRAIAEWANNGNVLAEINKKLPQHVLE